MKPFRKSKKHPPKTSKDGTKYIVFKSLPLDQQEAWNEINTCYNCMEIEDGEYCLYYHDYENFYNNWIKNKVVVHLD
jgi:hypothetical protein